MEIGGSTMGMFGLGGEDSSSSTKRNNWTPEQQQVAKKLGTYLNTQVGQASPAYTGQRVAPMSSQEQAAQGWLSTYMQSPTPQQYSWANDATQRAINGDYGAIVDPQKTKDLYNWTVGQANSTLNNAQSSDIIDPAATTALFNQIKDQTINRDLPELQNTLANNANLSGMYYSGGHEKAQGQLLSDTESNLLNTLANLRYSDEQAKRDLASQREARQYNTLADILGTSANQQYQDIATQQNVGQQREARQLDAAQLASQLGQQQDLEPLQKATAGMTYGSLPRTLEQQNLDAQYEDFLRTLAQNNPSLAQALQYLGLQGQSSTRTDASGMNWNLGGQLNTQSSMNMGMGMGGGS